MNDHISRLRMTPKEQKAAKMTGAVLLVPVLCLLAYLILPLFAAAAFIPGGPLIVAGAILGGGLLAGLASLSKKVRGFAGLAYATYLALFTKAYRTFFIEEDGSSQDESVSDQLESEDPIAKVHAAIARLRSQQLEMLLSQEAVTAFIEDCVEEEVSSRAEAEAFRQEALDADEDGDSSGAEHLIQKAGLKDETADAFAGLIAETQGFHDSLGLLSNRIDLDILRIEERVSLQAAQLRKANLQKVALGSHMGDRGELPQDELFVRDAMAELQAVAELRAAEIEIQLVGGSKVLAGVNIANVAGSRQALHQWSAASNELAALELPPSAPSRLGRRARTLSEAEPESAPDASRESDDERRARIRRELANRRRNKS